MYVFWYNTRCRQRKIRFSRIAAGKKEDRPRKGRARRWRLEGECRQPQATTTYLEGARRRSYKTSLTRVRRSSSAPVAFAFGSRFFFRLGRLRFYRFLLGFFIWFLLLLTWHRCPRYHCC